jgi:hypothetical protein
MLARRYCSAYWIELIEVNTVYNRRHILIHFETVINIYAYIYWPEVINCMSCDCWRFRLKITINATVLEAVYMVPLIYGPGIQ